jgi:hypothetical protein
MGVDIYAYRQLTLAPSVEPYSEAYEAGKYRAVYVNPDFPARAADLQDGAVYSYAECEDFLSRSYGNYNAWRDELAQMAGYASASDAWSNHSSGPFWELINFSDCEGVIGPAVSAKLARDFAEWDEKAAQFGEDFYHYGYRQLRAAFEMAADGGMVRFG